MAISKKSKRVIKVTYFEIVVCPPTSTLKLKVFMLKYFNILNTKFQDHKLKFYAVSFDALKLLIQESYNAKREERDL
jgi:hypothetical protein